MSTDRLKIYNGALLLCGDQRLASLTENREVRYLLDEVWNDGGQRYCLEQGQWHFAMRTSRFDYNPSITPSFGFQYGYDKPSDWVTTSGVFSDEYMSSPLIDYADEANQWFADVDEIFVRYVSDDTSYGLDMANWPATFVDFVKAYFASRIVHKVPGAASKVEFLLGPAGRHNKGWVNRTLLIARNKAAMALPTTFPSRGTWAQARHAGVNRTDGGNPNSLIG